MTKKEKLKYVAVILGAVIIGYGVVYYQKYLNESYTDDAYIKTDIVQISTKVGGHISDVYIDDYIHVEKGEKLYQIRELDYRLRLEQAEADLKVLEISHDKLAIEEDLLLADETNLKTSLEAAELSREISYAEYKKHQTLYKSKTISWSSLKDYEQTWKKAESDYQNIKYSIISNQKKQETLKYDRRILEHQIAAKKADIGLLQNALDNTTITAPVSGKTGKKMATTGQLVQPGTLLTVIVPDTHWIIANFKETQVGRMKKGQSVDITIDAVPGVTFKGKVDEISPASGAEFSLLPPDNATGNFTKIVQRIPVKIIFDDERIKNYKIAAGMSTEVTVKLN
jgi:membrane fusion protein (multidrug efflux system)